jgi:cytidyltransferase-like protein
MDSFQTKKVLISGCFDLLHSGHVAFIKSAASYGHVYVCLGSDKTVFGLKKRYPVNTENERKFNLEALRDVHEVCISSGSGYLDFLPELERIQPDIFVVNEDGFSSEKAELCKQKNIELIVLNRTPFTGLPARSTTDLRLINTIPFRIDLAGGWLDQPFVSLFASGPVITISIEPNHEFNNRSGMASSTRKVATELWQNQLPESNSEKTAKILFAYENPPGKSEIAGSQDAIGIVYAGLNKSYYEANYWPTKIDTVLNEDILDFIEQHLYLISLGPRKNDYHVLADTKINKYDAKALAQAADACWNAALIKDAAAFGESMRLSFEAQIAMFPNMIDDEILQIIQQFKEDVLGYKISGAGGGGYLIICSQKSIPDAIRIQIRRK